LLRGLPQGVAPESDQLVFIETLLEMAEVVAAHSIPGADPPARETEAGVAPAPTLDDTLRNDLVLLNDIAKYVLFGLEP